MAGPNISIVPENSQRVINMRPGVSIKDIQLQHNKNRNSVVPKKSIKRNRANFNRVQQDSMSEGSIEQRPIRSHHKKSTQRNEFPSLSDDNNSMSSFNSNDSQLDDTKNDGQYNNISNPAKRKNMEDDNSDAASSLSGSSGGSNSTFSSKSSYSSGNSRKNNKSFSHNEKQRLLDEKQELLYKFHRLEQKGIRSSRKFDINSSLEDMKIEYSKLTRQIEVEQSVKFQRRILMAFTSGLEFLNKRYDPFDVKLDGWSESIMEGIDDYDHVFERLHEKYKSKSEMAPEVELLLSLAGSAFMFHLTQTLFKSALPNMAEIAKQNPELMQNVASAMMQNMATQGNKVSASSGMQDNTQNIPGNGMGPPQPINPREMKGPSIPVSGNMPPGLGDMMGQLGPLGDMMQQVIGAPQFTGMPVGPPNPQLAREPNRAYDSQSDNYSSGTEIGTVSDIDFGNPRKTKNVLLTTSKRGKKNKNEVTINV